MPPVDPLIGEVHAALLALKFAFLQNLYCALFEGDSKSVNDVLQITPSTVIPQNLGIKNILVHARGRAGSLFWLEK